MPIRPTHKECKDCGISLVDDDGWPWKSGRCREHWLAYNRQKGRRHYAAHQEQERARDREYRARNAERLKEARKARWQKEKAVPVADRPRTAWRRANPERMRQYWAAARTKLKAKNPRYFADAAIERRIQAKPQAGKHTKDEWDEIVASFGGRCAYCGVGGRITKDHLVPLVRGGLNTAVNLVPACAQHNTQKGYGDPETFIERVVVCPLVRNDMLARVARSRLAGAGVPPPNPPTYTKVTTARLIADLERLFKEFGYLSTKLIREHSRYGCSTYHRRIDVKEEAQKMGARWVSGRPEKKNGN